MLCNALQVEVHRQKEIGAWLRRNKVERSHRAATGGDFQILFSGLTVQKVFVATFNADFSDILACPCREKIGRAKYIPEEELASFDGIFSEMNAELKAVAQGGEEDV